jgi:hypothetical protein
MHWRTSQPHPEDWLKAVWSAQRCSVAVVGKPGIACQSSVFFRHSGRDDQAGSGLKAQRSHARSEAKKRSQQGRAASVTGSDGIDNVKLGLLTGVVLSHHQR